MDFLTERDVMTERRDSQNKKRLLEVLVLLHRLRADNDFTIENILTKIASFSGEKVFRLRRDSRAGLLPPLRGVALYLLNRDIGVSYNRLGREFGYSDHTTPRSWVIQIEDALKKYGVEALENAKKIYPGVDFSNAERLLAIQGLEARVSETTEETIDLKPLEFYTGKASRIMLGLTTPQRELLHSLLIHRYISGQSFPNNLKLLEELAELGGVPAAYLVSARRDYCTTSLRNAAYHLLRSKGESYPVIAKLLHRKDHTSALWGYRRFEDAIKKYGPVLGMIFSDSKSLAFGQASEAVSYFDK